VFQYIDTLVEEMREPDSVAFMDIWWLTLFGFVFVFFFFARRWGGSRSRTLWQLFPGNRRRAAITACFDLCLGDLGF